MNSVKYILSVIGGTILAYFKLYGFAFAIVGIAVMLDLVTGILAALIDGEGLSSKKAYKGVLKKLSLFVALLFGTFLDMFVPYATNAVNIDLHVGLLFSTIISVYIVVTECISIIENIYKCNSNALPEWLKKLFSNAKNDLNDIAKTEAKEDKES